MLTFKKILSKFDKHLRKHFQGLDQTNHYYSLINVCHQITFKKNLMIRFIEKLLFFLGTKMTYVTHFGHNKNFP